MLYMFKWVQILIAFLLFESFDQCFKLSHCLKVYLLCCQHCLLFKHMQVLLHVLQGGSPVQRDSGVRVQPHAVLVHRRHIGRMIRCEDEVQSAQIEQNPGKPERHEQGEHELVWVSLP